MAPYNLRLYRMSPENTQEAEPPTPALNSVGSGPPEILIEPEESVGAKVFYIVKEIVITLLLFLVLRNLVVQARFIPSASMHPGLLEGDRLLVEVVSKHFASVKQGDILVFYRPGEPKPTLKELLLSSFGIHDDHAMIKRVIGLPGDIVEVIPNEGVKVNGQMLKENYTAEVASQPYGPKQVPAGHLLMMGDNRNQSSDGRIWGFLPLENIIGKATIRFYPFDRIGMIR